MSKVRSMLDKFALALMKLGDNVSGAHYTAYHNK